MGNDNSKSGDSKRTGSTSKKSVDGKKSSIFSKKKAKASLKNNKARSPDAPSSRMADKMSSSDMIRPSTQIILDITPNAERGEALKAIPLLSHLTKSERDKLGGAMQDRKFEQGDVIMAPGQPGEDFYVILSGTAVESTQMLGKSIVLSELSPGDYFGEQAILLNDVQRNEVKCTSDMTTMCLSKQAFQALFKRDRIDIVFARSSRAAVCAEVDVEPAEDARLRIFSEHEKKQFQREIPTEDLPPEIRSVVLAAMENSLLFENMDERGRALIARCFDIEEVDVHADIIVEGETGDHFYVILEGSFDVFQKDTEGVAQKCDHHGPGGAFGDLALLYNAPRNATVRAAEISRVASLERAWFAKVIKQAGVQRSQQYARWLGKVELLAPLSNAARATVAEALEEIDMKAGQVVFYQGDKGDAMYIVVEGQLEVTQTTADGKVEVLGSGLRPGNYFGERALLAEGAGRAATITCSTDCTLARLDKDAFTQLLGPLEELMKKKVKEYADVIKQETTWVAEVKRIEDLKVLGTLGRGSFGYVQLVQDVTTGKTYALKAVNKQRVVDTHQKEHVINEKNLMKLLDHPFLVKLCASFKDRNNLYFVLEPSLGGELFPILRKHRIFPPETARFFCGCVALAFQYMHSKDLIHRDLKPENLLLDEMGYVKLTDFGFCKICPNKTWTMCGTPEYLAPEVIASKGHGKGVDWWTLGILTYEMLASYTPFYDAKANHMVMYKRIIRGSFRFPSHFTPDAKDLITKLLQKKPTLRLGVVRGGAEQVINHPWFESVAFDWQALLWKKLEAPIPTNVKSANDLTNFQRAQELKIQHVADYVDDGTGWDEEF